MSSTNLVARVAVNGSHQELKTFPILEAAIEVQTAIMRAAAKCATITKFGAIPARVLDFELFKGEGGIDTIVLRYENPQRPSGEGNYLKKTFGFPYFCRLSDGELLNL